MVLENIGNIILVLSGKGGVGKSTVATQLALTLKDFGLKVGILDVDLCGPNIPYLVGVEGQEIFRTAHGWLPVYTDESKRLSIMSIGFLLKSKVDAVVWRGPRKNAMIRQFLEDVCWGELDYLIIDTPPGTSDEHMTVMEFIQNIENKGAIIVTSPQEVALEDVRKEITFCKKVGINIIGLIENMSGYVCSHCLNCTNIFSSNGGKELACYTKVTYLGTLPLDPKIGLQPGKLLSVVSESPESVSAKKFLELVNLIMSTINNRNCSI